MKATSCQWLVLKKISVSFSCRFLQCKWAHQTSKIFFIEEEENVSVSGHFMFIIINFIIRTPMKYQTILLGCKKSNLLFNHSNSNPFMCGNILFSCKRWYFIGVYNGKTMQYLATVLQEFRLLSQLCNQELSHNDTIFTDIYI